jgi:hypothetical protein
MQCLISGPDDDTTFWQITSAFKGQFLTWIGIVGGAITLFTNLGGFLNLADWARWLVVHWHEWMAAFWIWAFSWTGIHIPRVITPLLSFLLSTTLLIVGLNLKSRKSGSRTGLSADDHVDQSIPLKLGMLGIIILVTALTEYSFAYLVFVKRIIPLDRNFLPVSLLHQWMVSIIQLLILFGAPIFLVLMAKAKIWTGTNLVLFILCYIIAYYTVSTSE